MGKSPGTKSPVRVNIHSFFILPFFITAVGVLIFYWVWLLLTHEPRGVEDYLADVKIGGATKRWQSAYELSRILANPDLVPKDDRFVDEMMSAFEYARRDPDPRVKQYLLRAMGQSRIRAFSGPVRESLGDGNESVVADAVYSLGLIGGVENLGPLRAMADNRSPLVRNRAAIAMGNLGNSGAVDILRAMLDDPEPNVRWNAAVALARLGDSSGRRILLNLLDRKYLDQFEQVDGYERTQAMLVAIDAASFLNDSSLYAAIKKLSEEDVDMKIRTAAMKALEL